MRQPARHTRTAPDPQAVLTRATLEAARRLGLTQRELAAVLGSSEASVSRLGRSRDLPLGSKEAELAVLFLRLFRSLDALVGGDERQAAAWLAADNHHLGSTPVELMRKVEGLVSVVQYLDAMRGKL